ncbi:MAG: hypothetical protein ACTSQJ_01650 [Promethearchaeota archaeon]
MGRKNTKFLLVRIINLATKELDLDFLSALQKYLVKIAQDKDFFSSSTEEIEFIENFLYSKILMVKKLIENSEKEDQTLLF